jgi:eukaryotic-like serine/threonine-protein kinase
MHPDKWERVKDVYHAALDRDPGARAAYLREACGDDPEILTEVESLLAQPDEDSFLERPAWQAEPPAEPPAERAAESRPEDSPVRWPPFLWVVWLTLATLVAAFGYAGWKIVQEETDLTYAIFFFLLSLTWCAIGLFIGFARPQLGMARLAFAAAVLTGFVFLQTTEMRSFYALQPLHVVLGYHFFYLFPAGPPRARRWKTLLRLLYAGTAAFVARALWIKWLWFARGPRAATPWTASPIGTLMTLMVLVVGITAMVGAAVVAVHKYRALTDADERHRFHWIALGGVVGLAPPALLVVLGQARENPGVARWLLPGYSWQVFDMVTCGCSVAIPLSVAYAVVKHGVFGVKVAVRRGIRYLLARRALQVLLAVPTGALFYTVVMYRHRTIAELVTGTTAYLYWILALGLSLRFRVPLLQWLDRKFFHEQYDSGQVVFGLVDQLARFDSAEEVSGFVYRQLERSLHPKSMHLWSRKSGVMTLATTSDPSLQSTPLPVSEALLEKLTQVGTATRVPLPTSSGASGGDTRWLAERDVRLIVPVSGTDRVDAVLMLGEKQSEEPYSDGDVRLVHGMIQATAVMLDNLRLKGQVTDEQRIRHDVLAKLDRDLVSLMQECPVCGACYDRDVETCVRDGSALTLTLPVARTLDGKYRLDRLMGRGGMGAVYEARDLRLGREVAVKVMLGGTFGHESALRRFRREAQAVARLNHPNIVALYDFGELEGGGAYLVMELLHGATLRSAMKRAGGLSAGETADWFEQMLDGLAAAHEQGVVHRDFKPENVLGVRVSGGSLAVKILDFGLAKVRPLPAATQASHRLTESGVVLGTLAYMAPEQLLGQEVDARADVYSAGVMLVEMLTRARPFADGADIRPDYRLPPGIPNHAALDAVLRHCLAMAPHERFLSATELRSALIPVLRRSGTNSGRTADRG